MSNKPIKFGIKFFLAVDVEHKYMFNGLPYCGKDENRLKGISLPTDVVLKLLEPVFNAGYNVTCATILLRLTCSGVCQRKNVVCLVHCVKVGKKFLLWQNRKSNSMITRFIKL